MAMELEQILAGPIVRAVDPRRVLIWLATSKEERIGVEIYLAGEAGETGSGSPGMNDLEVIGNNEAEPPWPRTVKLGKRLFVSLLAAVPIDGEYPTDQLLFYDITVGGKTLSDLGLLDPDTGIRYPPCPLPSFFIPSRSRNFLHGSCR